DRRRVRLVVWVAAPREGASAFEGILRALLHLREPPLLVLAAVARVGELVRAALGDAVVAGVRVLARCEERARVLEVADGAVGGIVVETFELRGDECRARRREQRRQDAAGEHGADDAPHQKLPLAPRVAP